MRKKTKSMNEALAVTQYQEEALDRLSDVDVEGLIIRLGGGECKSSFSWLGNAARELLKIATLVQLPDEVTAGRKIEKILASFEPDCVDRILGAIEPHRLPDK